MKINMEEVLDQKMGRFFRDKRGDYSPEVEGILESIDRAGKFWNTTPRISMLNLEDLRMGEKRVESPVNVEAECVLERMMKKDMFLLEEVHKELKRSGKVKRSRVREMVETLVLGLCGRGEMDELYGDKEALDRLGEELLGLYDGLVDEGRRQAEERPRPAGSWSLESLIKKAKELRLRPSHFDLNRFATRRSLAASLRKEIQGKMRRQDMLSKEKHNVHHRFAHFVSEETHPSKDFQQNKISPLKKKTKILHEEKNKSNIWSPVKKLNTNKQECNLSLRNRSKHVPSSAYEINNIFDTSRKIQKGNSNEIKKSKQGIRDIRTVNSLKTCFKSDESFKYRDKTKNVTNRCSTTTGVVDNFLPAASCGSFYEQKLFCCKYCAISTDPNDFLRCINIGDTKTETKCYWMGSEFRLKTDQDINKLEGISKIKQEKNDNYNPSQAKLEALRSKVLEPNIKYASKRKFTKCRESNDNRSNRDKYRGMTQSLLDTKVKNQISDIKKQSNSTIKIKSNKMINARTVANPEGTMSQAERKIQTKITSRQLKNKEEKLTREKKTPIVNVSNKPISQNTTKDLSKLKLNEKKVTTCLSQENPSRKVAKDTQERSKLLQIPLPTREKLTVSIVKLNSTGDTMEKICMTTAENKCAGAEKAVGTPTKTSQDVQKLEESCQEDLKFSACNSFPDDHSKVKVNQAEEIRNSSIMSLNTSAQEEQIDLLSRVDIYHAQKELVSLKSPEESISENIIKKKSKNVTSSDTAVCMSNMNIFSTKETHSQTENTFTGQSEEESIKSYGESDLQDIHGDSFNSLAKDLPLVPLKTHDNSLIFTEEDKERSKEYYLEPSCTSSALIQCNDKTYSENSSQNLDFTKETSIISKETSVLNNLILGNVVAERLMQKFKKESLLRKKFPRRRQLVQKSFQENECLLKERNSNETTENSMINELSLSEDKLQVLGSYCRQELTVGSSISVDSSVPILLKTKTQETLNSSMTFQQEVIGTFLSSQKERQRTERKEVLGISLIPHQETLGREKEEAKEISVICQENSSRNLVLGVTYNQMDKEESKLRMEGYGKDAKRRARGEQEESKVKRENELDRKLGEVRLALRRAPYLRKKPSPY